METRGIPPINGKVFRWIRERAGYKRPELAEFYRAKAQKLRQAGHEKHFPGQSSDSIKHFEMVRTGPLPHAFVEVLVERLGEPTFWRYYSLARTVLVDEFRTEELAANWEENGSASIDTAERAREGRAR